jgi:hypothetical protein
VTKKESFLALTPGLNEAEKEIEKKKLEVSAGDIDISKK